MTDPAGNSFPERKRLRTQLGPVLGPVGNLGANQGSFKYDELDYIYQNQSDIYYRPQNLPSETNMQVDSEYSVAFAESDIPTSSTNYSRPRTVAAGYDAERQTMTVVFRDGTFYNYYQITPGEWRAFKASISKGNPWLNKANKNQGTDGLFIGKPRGPAEVQSISPAIRELLYRVVRTQQIYRGPKLSRGKVTPSKARSTQRALKANRTRRNQQRRP